MAIIITKFETKYFYIVSSYDEKFINWDTVEGILNEDIRNDYEVISNLMAQDVRDKFGEEYECGKLLKTNLKRE